MLKYFNLGQRVIMKSLNLIRKTFMTLFWSGGSFVKSNSANKVGKVVLSLWFVIHNYILFIIGRQNKCWCVSKI